MNRRGPGRPRKGKKAKTNNIAVSCSEEWEAWVVGIVSERTHYPVAAFMRQSVDEKIKRDFGLEPPPESRVPSSRVHIGRGKNKKPDGETPPGVVAGSDEQGSKD